MVTIAVSSFGVANRVAIPFHFRTSNWGTQMYRDKGHLARVSVLKETPGVLVRAANLEAKEAVAGERDVLDQFSQVKTPSSKILLGTRKLICKRET